MLFELETHELKKLAELLTKAGGQDSLRIQWLIFDIKAELEKRAKLEKQEKKHE